MDFINKEIFEPAEASDEYKEAMDKFYSEISKFPKDTELIIEELVSNMEALSKKSAYKKGFGDGIRFILNVLAGKEVIEI